jgi:hypothetical protein
MKKYLKKEESTNPKNLKYKILLWNEKNKEVIESYHKRIKINDLFSDGLRSF